MKESASPGLPVIRSRIYVLQLRFPKAGRIRRRSKRAFHNHARRRLKQLADALGLVPGSFDLRSNPGGIAVSGEATLHADHLYVQACQPATGHDTGILFRTCQGRKDYHGGPNNFASLDLLNRPQDLARRITEACRV
jgi:hypothetical protein